MSAERRVFAKSNVASSGSGGVSEEVYCAKTTDGSHRRELFRFGFDCDKCNDSLHKMIRRYAEKGRVLREFVWRLVHLLRLEVRLSSELS